MTASHANWSQQQRRKDLLFAALALAVLACLAVMALWVQGLAQDRDALARQVQDLGGTPVAGPPGLRGEPGEGVTGPTGEPGEKGEKGDPGESGKPAPTLTPSPGASGASGAPGRPGADSTVPGPSGPPGADSTVPGPAGPAGPQGEPGPAGVQGETGEQGPPGPTCPDGYSLQAPSWDPDALVCRRDGAPQPDPPGNGNNPQASALDPQRRQYT